MLESDYQKIKTKIFTGVIALSSRTLLLQIVSFISTFILTVLLTPEMFGVFFVVSAVISFLTYFSDIGLAAALIQKKEEPTNEELSGVFTLQNILVLTLILLAFLLSGFISEFYTLNHDEIILYHSLLFSFFLSSLKTIPSVLLERRLEFTKLIFPQLIETIAFYFIAIICAYSGLGVLSFAYAALTRGAIGTILIYIISPWRISLSLSIDSMKKLISFGIPFQTNSLLALIKDDLMTVFLGKILPFNQLGYIGWAKKWAEAPLRLIMDSIIRVTFPTYSRLQHDKKILGKAIHQSIFFLSVFIFPLVISMLIVIRPLIEIIPKYSKWEPALISFYIFSISTVFASFSTPITNALNAIGKIKITLYLMIFWTTLTWIFVPTFIYFIGFNGMAYAILIISLTGVIPMLIIRKYVDFSPFQDMLKCLLISVIYGIILYFFTLIIKDLLIFLIILTIIFIFYLLIILFTFKKYFNPFISILWRK
jgi:PST family polysaccharide transporter